MNPISTYTEALLPYRNHLNEVWLRADGADKTVDPNLREDYETAQAALAMEESDIAVGILDTGSYLIDCYERLVLGKRVGGLAEAEGGYNYYLRKLEQVPEVGRIPGV